MSTRFYACENCEKWIGNGALTREHLQVYPDHIFIEFWNRDGRPPKVRKGNDSVNKYTSIRNK